MRVFPKLKQCIPSILRASARTGYTYIPMRTYTLYFYTSILAFVSIA
jgi:hypothetical protein